MTFSKILPRHYLAISIMFCSLTAQKAQGIDLTPSNIALGNNYTLNLVGGYRFQDGTFGDSRIGYAVGPIAVSSNDDMVYVAGHTHHFAVGGFAFNKEPQLGRLDMLPIIPSSVPFTRVSPPHKPQSSANRITGLEILGNQLLVMTDEYYDADGNNKENLVIFENRYDLKGSDQIGYFHVQGSTHAAGWMSEILPPLSNELKAIYLTGSASNFAINVRNSIGPTLFTWFPFFINKAKPIGRTLSTESLLDYSLQHPLHEDAYNETRQNDLWTEVSTAVYGFISPNQKHYIVIGTSGGHESGIGYKITQDNGRKCAGPCAFKHDDYYNHFWIYNTSDIKQAQEGSAKPYELRPVEYGKLSLFSHRHLIIGADFNFQSKRLYLLINNLDATQSRFEVLPVLLVFELMNKT